MYRRSRFNRGWRPQPRTIVVRYTKVHNAKIDLDGGLQLNIHLLHRRRELFKGESAGYKEEAVLLEELPYDIERWYEILVTLTRQRKPEEVLKNRHKRRLDKGLPVLIKVGKPFHFDPRRDRRSAADAFQRWLQTQSLPPSLQGEVERIILGWVKKKGDKGEGR